MNIRIVTDADEFLALAEFWNGVLEKSRQNYPFLTHEWMTSWWLAFGGKRELFILLAEHDGAVAPHGIAPLCIVKEYGIKIPEFIGTGESDY